MAVDMFLKLDSIKGESKQDGHKDEIDVQSWSWGLSNSATAHLGGGSGSGKVSVQDISFTHFTDSSSPDLLKCCCIGKHISKGTLVVRKAGGKAIDYIKLELEQIMVTNIHNGGSGHDDRLIESVTLNFSKFKYSYAEQTETGAKGKEGKFGYDIQQGKEA